MRDFLHARFAEAGVRARVHVVKPSPTASLTRRAARLAATIDETAGRARSRIHLIGHSSGGIDARLFASPGVRLPTDVNVERLAARLHTVVTVSSPHRGTPLAAFLSTRLGEQALEMISLSTIYLLRYGHLPLRAMLQLGGIFTRLDNAALNSAVLDEFFSLLLAKFSVGRRRAVETLFREVASDRALLVQLTPDAMQVFNATVQDRPGVKYLSIVTRAPRPGLATARATGLDPSGQALHAVWGTIHTLTAGSAHEHLRLSRSQSGMLRRAYGKVPSSRSNDGIVPTTYQVWGEVLAALDADHLDVIGHFSDPSTRPPHVDWMTTGSGFTRDQFESLWTSTAVRIVA